MTRWFVAIWMVLFIPSLLIFWWMPKSQKSEILRDDIDGFGLWEQVEQNYATNDAVTRSRMCYARGAIMDAARWRREAMEQRGLDRQSIAAFVRLADVSLKGDDLETAEWALAQVKVEPSTSIRRADAAFVTSLVLTIKKGDSTATHDMLQQLSQRLAERPGLSNLALSKAQYTGVGTAVWPVLLASGVYDNRAKEKPVRIRSPLFYPREALSNDLEPSAPCAVKFDISATGLISNIRATGCEEIFAAQARKDLVQAAFLPPRIDGLWQARNDHRLELVYQLSDREQQTLALYSKSFCKPVGSASPLDHIVNLRIDFDQLFTRPETSSDTAPA